METGEIGAVLARATELHTKISDAIERTLKKRGDESVRVAGGGQNNKDGNASEEAQSLEGIRDALGILEEQLQSLQKLQQQQRVQKETIIAELEKCRRVLLKRVKEHCGKEREVVREALAFAGEPVEDDEADLNFPPDRMVPDSGSTFDSPTSSTEDPSAFLDERRENNRWGWGAHGIRHQAERDEDEEHASFNVRHGKKEGGGGLLGIPLNFTKALFSHAFGMTTKAPVVLLSVAAALAMLELRQREGETRGWSFFELRRREGEKETRDWPSRLSSSRESSTTTSPPPTVTVRQLPPHRDCPPGTKLVLEDGSVKYAANNRVEHSFSPEIIIIPDVLCGRG